MNSGILSEQYKLARRSFATEAEQAPAVPAG